MSASQNYPAVRAALNALSKDAEWLNQNVQQSSDFMVKELKLSPAVAKQATKNRGRESVTLPTVLDISNLQKTADWMLEQKIIPAKVNIANAVCPTS